LHFSSLKDFISNQGFGMRRKRDLQALKRLKYAAVDPGFGKNGGDIQQGVS
jgi:hypothetical protein